MKITLLFFFLSLSTCLLAQQSLNPNNVLVVSKEGKKKPSVFRTGQTIKCRQKDGTKVKGTLYVYSDHLIIDNTRVNFQEIQMIKGVNYRPVTSQLSGMAFNEYIRSQTNGTLNTFYWVRNLAFLGFNLTVFNRKFKLDEGWNLTVREIPAFNFRRRR